MLHWDFVGIQFPAVHVGDEPLETQNIVPQGEEISFCALTVVSGISHPSCAAVLCQSLIFLALV